MLMFVAKDTKAQVAGRYAMRIAEFVSQLAPQVQDKYRHNIRYFGLLAPRANGPHAGRSFHPARATPPSSSSTVELAGLSTEVFSGGPAHR